MSSFCLAEKSVHFSSIAEAQKLSAEPTAASCWPPVLSYSRDVIKTSPQAEPHLFQYNSPGKCNPPSARHVPSALTCGRGQRLRLQPASRVVPLNQCSYFLFGWERGLSRKPPAPCFAPAQSSLPRSWWGQLRAARRVSQPDRGRMRDVVHHRPPRVFPAPPLVQSGGF